MSIPDDICLPLPPLLFPRFSLCSSLLYCNYHHICLVTFLSPTALQPRLLLLTFLASVGLPHSPCPNLALLLFPKYPLTFTFFFNVITPHCHCSIALPYCPFSFSIFALCMLSAFLPSHNVRVLMSLPICPPPTAITPLFSLRTFLLRPSSN